MSESELQAQLSEIISDSIDFADTELAPSRVKATEYYKGEKFGNEEEGRSQFIITEVRDGVLGVLPDMLRVVFGPERVVEFTPRSQMQVDAAAQATDAIQFIFAEDNPGFLITHSVLKDGLIRQLGAVKWAWEDGEIRTYHLEDVPEAALQRIIMEPGVEVVRAVEKAAPALLAAPAILGPDGQPMSAPQPAPEPLYDVELTHKHSDGRARVWALPPEEFLYDREARSLDDAVFIGHRTIKTTSELRAMGISKADIEEHGGGAETLDDSSDINARKDDTNSRAPELEGTARHLYVESYVKIDFDGDGNAELRRICTLGPAHYVVENEPCADRPFAVFCPDPEPHTMRGQSWADRLMDLQLIKSSLMRGMNDSLAASIFPRTAYTEGVVSVEDLLNNDIGAPIRVKGASPANALQEFKVDFAGREALPIMSYLDEVAERRTGKNKGVQGLDADALQSSTKTAVAAAITASQAQSEMLLRIFAEQFLKPMFRGLLKLYSRNASKPRMMRMRGKWAEVDPRVWDADMDVSVAVAMGTGATEQKVGVLVGIAAKQEQILQLLGPMNPIVSVSQYANTLRDLCELGGRKDTSRYFNEVDPNWQPPPVPPQPNAELEWVKVEAQKVQLQAQAERQKLEVELQEQRTKAQIEQQKRLLEAAKGQAEVQKAELQRQLDEAKASSGANYNDDKLDQDLIVKRMEDQRMREEAEKKLLLEIQKLAEESEARLAQQEIERAKLALEAQKMEVERQKIASAEKIAETQAKAAKAQAKEAKQPQQPAAAKPKKVRVVRDDSGRIAGFEDEPTSSSTGKTNGNS